ncbi:MAG: beta-1,6-N-acetylglucosaminyltransferase [Bacteroidia bacterium]
MELAILILAHQYPRQISKLVNSLLTDDDVTVFIHVDSRSTETFNSIQKEFAHERRVFFVKKRYKVYWGSFNQVRATLELLTVAKQNGKFDYYSLISGQDLLIKPISEYKKFLTANKGKEFLAWYKLPHHENHGETGGMDRMELYWMDIKPRYKYFYAKTNDIIHKVQRRLNYKRRLRFDLYSGAQWFTLSAAAIDHILKFTSENVSFYKAFKYSRCADEIFFHTLMLNSPLKENIVNDCLRYIDWKSGPEFPKILRTEDLDRLCNAENKFFGRKFDEKIDPGVIEKLNSYVNA